MRQLETGQQIPHKELHEQHLPQPNAQWSTIVLFASTFNAYAQLGREATVVAGNKTAQDPTACSLDELRAALFFEYRRYNHFGYDPDSRAMAHVHLLVEEIRRRIHIGEHLHGSQA